MEQWYSEAYFPGRQIHVIHKDVRFLLKGKRSNNRIYSLSNSHARITIEIFLSILTAITILSLIISCNDVNNARGRNLVFKKMCFNNIWPRIDIPLYGLCVDIAKETFSNRKKQCLIDRFMNENRDFARGVSFQQHAMFQADV